MSEIEKGWIEKAIELVDHSDIDNHVVKASAAAELATLRTKIQDEFDIASGYYKQLQKAQATGEAQNAEIAEMQAAESLGFERVMGANKAYNQAHGIEDERHTDLGVLVGWLMDERTAQAKQTWPPLLPPWPFEAMQRAASRACDVMSECVEHGECEGADRAEMKEAEKQLLDALLDNSSGSPNGSQAAPTDYEHPDELARLRRKQHETTLKHGDIASRVVTEWLEEYQGEDATGDILLHLEADRARGALTELEVLIIGALERTQATQIETMRESLDHSATLLGNVIQAFGDEEGDSAEMILADCGDGIVQIRKTLSSTPSTVAVVPLERLREIEWAKDVKILPVGAWAQCCPACHGLTWAEHEPDCWLHAAIRAAEKETH